MIVSTGYDHREAVARFSEKAGRGISAEALYVAPVGGEGQNGAETQVM